MTCGHSDIGENGIYDGRDDVDAETHTPQSGVPVVAIHACIQSGVLHMPVAEAVEFPKLWAISVCFDPTFHNDLGNFLPEAHEHQRLLTVGQLRDLNCVRSAFGRELLNRSRAPDGVRWR